MTVVASKPHDTRTASELLCNAVRRGDQTTVQRILRRPDLPKIAVELALLVPKRRAFGIRPECYRDEATLRPCGTHAAFNRHKARLEEPCTDCVQGERIYQADKARARRASDKTSLEIVVPGRLHYHMPTTGTAC